MRDLASHRIARVYRKMVKLGTAIDDDSPAEDLHDARADISALLDVIGPTGSGPAVVVPPRHGA